MSSLLMLGCGSSAIGGAPAPAANARITVDNSERVTVDEQTREVII